MASDGLREVEMLARQIEALKMTQSTLLAALDEARKSCDRTLIEVVGPEEPGKRCRRDDDIDLDGSSSGSGTQKYRSLSRGDSLDEDAFSSIPNYPGAGRSAYRGDDSDSDIDDERPIYRAVTILRSSSGPADEFDGSFADDEEQLPTYRSASAAAAGAGTSAPGATSALASASPAGAAGGAQRKLDVLALQELVVSLGALAAKGAAANENDVLQQLQRVKQVLG